VRATPATAEIAAWHSEAERALNRRAHELCLKILSAQPDFADAFFLLAMIAAEHDNFGKAIEVIDRALTLDPDRADYHAQRGRCLVSLRRPREAFEAATRALELDPDDALTLDTIGVVMTRAGAHAEALEPFKQAVARDSGKAAYQYNLGAALQFVGDFAAAEVALRRALALDRNFHRAWSSLAQVARAPFTATEITALEQMLASGTLDADAELHTCHALAKQCEDRGDYAAAFRYLERGKRRKRATLDYSFATDRELFAAARGSGFCGSGFSRDPTSASGSGATPGGSGFSRDAQAPGHPSTEPIFIVGMPRTGTTLVERILSSHPDVFAAGELTNFGLILKRMAQTPSNRVLDPETLAAGASLDAARLGDAYVESTRPRTGRTPRFIDKMPLNFFYASLINRALPNAKIVCLRRGALDACLSNYRQLFATTFSYYNYSYDLLDTGRYYVEFDALARHWRQTLPVASYREIRYEDVVDDTEREARALIEFCGLEWDPACLAFHENAAPVATASSVQVRKPIYRTSVERWRKYQQEIEPLRRLLDEAGCA
jgi:tetratricopeptide (TPR) repeat protein